MFSAFHYLPHIIAYSDAMVFNGIYAYDNVVQLQLQYHYWQSMSLWSILVAIEMDKMRVCIDPTTI